jgi:hypothetical protein
MKKPQCRNPPVPEQSMVIAFWMITPPKDQLRAHWHRCHRASLHPPSCWRAATLGATRSGDGAPRPFHFAALARITRYG